MTAITHRCSLSFWWHFHAQPEPPQLWYHLKETLISRVDVSWPPWGFTETRSSRPLAFAQRLSSLFSSLLFLSLLSLFQVLGCFIFLSAHQPQQSFQFSAGAKKLLNLSLHLFTSTFTHFSAHFSPPPPSVQFFFLFFFFQSSKAPPFHAPHQHFPLDSSVIL